MKKSLLVAIGIIVVILLLLPNLVGGLIQTATVDKLLEMVPDDANDALVINQSELQRGWFSSQAQIQVSLPELDQLTGRPVTLTLDMDIQHGPILFTSQGIRLGIAYSDIDPDLVGISTENTAQSAELDVTDPLFFMFAGFNNTAELGFGLERFSLNNADISMTMENLDGLSFVEPDLSGYGTIILELVDVSAADGSFDLSLQNFSFEGSESNISEPISPGRSSFSLTRATSSAPLPLVISDVSAEYQLNYDAQDQQSLNFSQLFNMGSIEWDIPVNTLQWQFELNRLNRELLENYILLVQQSQTTSTNNQAQTSSQLTELGQEFTLLLAQDSFDFNNTVNTNAFEGDHTFDLQINWPGLPALSSLNDFDLREALNVLQVSLSLDADHAALMNSPIAQMITEYQRQNMLSVSNGRIRVDARLVNGELSVNGEILPLDQFF